MAIIPRIEELDNRALERAYNFDRTLCDQISRDEKILLIGVISAVAVVLISTINNQPSKSLISKSINYPLFLTILSVISAVVPKILPKPSPSITNLYPQNLYWYSYHLFLPFVSQMCLFVTSFELTEIVASRYFNI